MGFFEDVGSGMDKAARGFGREWDRAVGELGENMKRDGAKIEEATQKGGMLGGVVEACDVFSVGHQVVNVGDAFNVIPEDPAIQEGISAGVNLGVGLALASATGVPVFALGGALLAAKDVADICAVPSTHPAASAPYAAQQPAAAMEQRRNGQCGTSAGEPMSKYEQLKAHKAAAREAAKDAAVEKAIERRNEARAEARAEAKERAVEKALARRDGYAQGYEDGVNDALIGVGCDVGACNDLIDSCEEHFGKDKTDQVNDRIDDILNNPNLCFEDMIFELLRAIMKDSQGQAREMANELTTQRNDEKKLKDGFKSKIDTLTEAIQKEPDQAKKNDLQNELQNVREERASELGFSAESRNQTAENLKNLLQKLSEMQQAMSNVLNNQHESAMATIRAIR